MAHDYVDIARVRADFDDLLNTIGTPVYQRAFGSASTHIYYGGGAKTYGTSTITSFTGGWRYVTAQDYRLIEAGRVAVGDVVMYIPSGIVTIADTDEYYLKGSPTDYFNLGWKQDQLVGSQICFYECGLTKARGKR